MFLFLLFSGFIVGVVTTVVTLDAWAKQQQR